MSKQVLEDRVIVDGYVNLKILYLSEEAVGVHCYEQSVPFNKTITLKSDSENHIVDVTSKVEYINCRAVNQRRVDVRGAISFDSKTFSYETEEIEVDEYDGTIEQLHEKILYNNVVNTLEKTFTTNEIITIPCEDNQEIVTLRTEETISIDDYKCIQNKIIVKGQIDFEIVYKENKMDNDIKTYKQSIPFSQILDAENVDENCQCQLTGKTLSCMIDKTENGDNDFSISIYASIYAKCYKIEESNVLVDAYSTKYKTDFEIQNTEFDYIKSLTKEIKNEKLIFEQMLNDGDAVSDMFCNIIMKDYLIKDGNAEINCVVDANFIVSNTDESVSMHNKNVTHTFVISAKDFTENEMCNIELIKHKAAHNINGKIIELKIEAEFCVIAIERREIKFINKVNVNKEEEKENDDTSSLTIYYGDKNEKIWDIAKRYNTNVNEIMKQNSIEDNQLKTRKMLLIPIVR